MARRSTGQSLPSDVADTLLDDPALEQISYLDFVRELKIKLTMGQETFARIAFDGQPP